MKYYRREFSGAELDRILHLAAEPKTTRFALSRSMPEFQCQSMMVASKI